MDTSVQRNVSLSLDMYPKDFGREKMLYVPYLSTVGTLMLAMTCKWPEICYVVGLVSRFQPGLQAVNGD